MQLDWDLSNQSIFLSFQYGGAKFEGVVLTKLFLFVNWGGGAPPNPPPPCHPAQYASFRSLDVDALALRGAGDPLQAHHLRTLQPNRSMSLRSLEHFSML